MTRLPAGRRSSRYPSPCQNSVGGVERSTSRTNPGRGIPLSSLFFAEVEGHLDGAARSRTGGVLDGLLEAVERIQDRDEAREFGVLHEVEGLGEVLGGVRVCPAQRDL